MILSILDGSSNGSKEGSRNRNNEGEILGIFIGIAVCAIDSFKLYTILGLWECIALGAVLFIKFVLVIVVRICDGIIFRTNEGNELSMRDIYHSFNLIDIKELDYTY